MADLIESTEVKFTFSSVSKSSDSVTTEAVRSGEIILFPEETNLIDETELVIKILNFPKEWLRTSSVFRFIYADLYFDITEIDDSGDELIATLKQTKAL